MPQLKEFQLLEGEQIIEQLEGNAYNDSPNPFVQLFMFFVKIFWLILGIRLRSYLIITNLRIVKVDKKTLLWGMLQGDTVVLTLNKRSIQSTGYAMATSWLIFKKYYFILENTSGTVKITYDGDKEKLATVCNHVDKMVSSTGQHIA